MKVRLLLASLVVTVCFPGLHIRAQEIAPPKESTATLEKTLTWLGRHIETSFTYGYSSIESSGDTATASHHESSVSRTPIRFEDCNISWRDGDQIIAVPLAQLDPSGLAVAVHSEANTKFDEELWAVALVTRGEKVGDHPTNQRGDQTRSVALLLFNVQESAGRFAEHFSTQPNSALNREPIIRELVFEVRKLIVSGS